MDFFEKYRERTKQFALDILNLAEHGAKNAGCSVLLKQLIRSGTSVGANFRAVTRARSDKEFFAKYCIVVEEADESAFWLELLLEKKYVPEKDGLKLLTEANELVKVFASIKKKLRIKLNSQVTHNSPPETSGQ